MCTDVYTTTINSQNPQKTKNFWNHEKIILDFFRDIWDQNLESHLTLSGDLSAKSRTYV